MKILLPFLFSLCLLFGCKKTTDNCTDVTVTLKANSCKQVGITLSDGTIFPCDDLPNQYAVEGKRICILFNFWEDLSTCACCGGTKISIIAVR
jgi:hypothetical protein